LRKRRLVVATTRFSLMKSSRGGRNIISLVTSCTRSSDVVPSALLQLDESPAARFGVVDIFRNPGYANGISHKLNFVLHPCGELTSLDLAIHMDFLSAAGYDENWNVSGLQ